MSRADATKPSPDGTARRNHTVILGVVAAPGVATELAARLRPDLAERIRARLPDVDWEIRFVSDRLIDGPADLTQLISAARRMMIHEQWHLSMCLTDLPLQTARRPLVAHSSMTHGVAVLSLPALGAVGVTRRASEAIVRLVAALVGDTGAGSDGGRRRHAALARRLHELGDQVAFDSQGSFGVVTGVITGNLRLLLGMLRSNRPWRLTIRLSRALVAALAAAVFALITSDVWRLADQFGAVRLALLTACSVTAVLLTIVLGAGLWERAPASGPGREQMILFNLVTLATVAIGVLALYLALLALNLVGAFLLVPHHSLADALGHNVGVPGVAGLAWFATSVATMGGALGAGLESDEAVREAAYGFRGDDRLSR